MDFKSTLSNLLSARANVWLVVVLTLAVLVFASIVSAASGHPLISGAILLKPRVYLVNETGERYGDSITVGSDSILMLGWTSRRVSSCQSNGWVSLSGLNQLSIPVGPFSNSTTLSVTCTAKSGSVSDSLQVVLKAVEPSVSVPAPIAADRGGQSDALAVTSPGGGEVWERGTSQTIRWTAPAAVSKVNLTVEAWFPSCNVNPLSGAMCPGDSAPQYHLVNQIATGTLGSYAWRVGDHLEKNVLLMPAGKYVVLVNAFVDNQSLVGRSQLFSIVEATRGSGDPAPATGANIIRLTKGTSATVDGYTIAELELTYYK